MTTTLTAIENLLDTIAQLADEERTQEIKAVVAQARADLAGGVLVTPAQAAHLLGVSSETTVRIMMRGGEIAETRRVGDETLIPLREIERLRDTDLIRDLRAINVGMASGALFDDYDEFTSMSQEDMDILEAGRPGTAPWLR